MLPQKRQILQQMLNNSAPGYNIESSDTCMLRIAGVFVRTMKAGINYEICDQT